MCPLARLVGKLIFHVFAGPSGQEIVIMSIVYVFMVYGLWPMVYGLWSLG